MKLFVNGCSFTWGGEMYNSLYDHLGNALDYDNKNPVNLERLSRVWPSHLAKHLNADECVNLSLGAGSNDRIIRTTLDFFTQCQNVDNWIAVIQLTHPHRFEYWENQSQAWALITPSAAILEKNSHHHLFDQLDTFKNQVYKNYNDYTFSQKYWTQVIGLSNFFVAQGIPYYFVNLLVDDSWYNLLHQHQQAYLDSHVSWIGNGPRHNLVDMFESKFKSVHPTDLGHQQIADYFYQQMKDKVVQSQI
jgi:hypothetical protein